MKNNEILAEIDCLIAYECGQLVNEKDSVIKEIRIRCIRVLRETKKRVLLIDSESVKNAKLTNII